jgi:hypothetical protein
VKAENRREIPSEHLGASAAHYYVPVVQSQARQDGSCEWPPGLARRLALVSKLGGDQPVQVRFCDQLALQALSGHPGQLLLPASRFARYRDESHSVES